MTRSLTFGPPAILADQPVGHWIDGRRAGSTSGSAFETRNPATGDVLATVSYGGDADVDAAVRAAEAAFHGPWSETSPARRGALMWRLADLLDERAEELALVECLDNGKPLVLARADVAGAAEHLRYFAGWPTKIEGEVIPVSRPSMHVYTRKEPIGVCAQIVPWNFPVRMAAWKIAPVLATGCTTVLKPAEQTPLSALIVGELATEAGIPDGVVNVLAGDGTTGAGLVDHPLVRKVAFTGSTSVGREIAAACGAALKHVTLELGGKSPNIILPDADLDAAIGGAFRALYFNSGQVCSAGSRLFVHEEQYDRVVTGLAGVAASAKLGPGLMPDTELGPVISAEQRDRVLAYVDSGRRDGAALVTGGGVPDGASVGYFVEPTLFADVTDGMAVAREEIFGPVLAVLRYDELDEVARRANDTDYGLAAGVWTRDISSAHRLAALLDAGSVYLNGWGTGDPAAPFGGMKASGIGREKGHANLDAYLQVKTVYATL